MEAAKEQLLDDLQPLDSHLHAQTFVVGNFPSLADVALAVDLRPAFEKVRSYVLCFVLVDNLRPGTIESISRPPQISMIMMRLRESTDPCCRPCLPSRLACRCAIRANRGLDIGVAVALTFAEASMKLRRCSTRQPGSGYRALRDGSRQSQPSRTLHKCAVPDLTGLGGVCRRPAQRPKSWVLL